jgi:deoxycytidylate deaminase
MTEFDYLRIMTTRKSTCDKVQVAAGCYIGDSFVSAANSCKHTGQLCPRLDLPSGKCADLCESQHAEMQLLSILKERYKNLKDGVIPYTVWIYGHYYACESCARALRNFGIKELRIKET